MTKRCLILLIAAGTCVGCGSSGRKLESIAVTPTTADAQDFPDGQVQFTATGTYSSSPSIAQLDSTQVTWCVGSSDGTCAGLVNPGAAVDANGLAHCNSGFSGTATILAGVPGQAGNPDAGVPLAPFGSAQLTCP